ncbi:MAG: hypothetical protein VB031_02280 [Eubacteriaceae bacterium]|nr:hypothetical protein [Eubacteriaceae bacterium]
MDMNDILVIWAREEGGYAVRPLGWSVETDREGRLRTGSKVEKEFKTLNDAEEYTKARNLENTKESRRRKR